MYKPIQNRTIYARVVQQIRDAIRDGRIPLGQKLPSERELSETFGVSRASIRVAISALEAVGTVEVRKGQGTFVTANREAIDSVGRFLSATEIGASEMWEARIVIICGIAGISASRNSEFLRTSLRAKVEEGRLSLSRGDMDSLRKIHEEIHEIIRSGSSNRAIAQVIELLDQMMLERLSRAIKLQAYSDSVAGEFHQSALEAVVSAIEIGDSGAARETMRLHLEKLAMYVDWNAIELATDATTE